MKEEAAGVAPPQSVFEHSFTLSVSSERESCERLFATLSFLWYDSEQGQYPAGPSWRRGGLLFGGKKKGQEE